jgi:hypothetical protein
LVATSVDRSTCGWISRGKESVIGAHLAGNRCGRSNVKGSMRSLLLVLGVSAIGLVSACADDDSLSALASTTVPVSVSSQTVSTVVSATPGELPGATGTVEISPSPPPLRDFTNTGACSNLFVYAVTGDGRNALLFDFELDELDDVVEVSFDLPDPNVEATFQTGSALKDPLCNDLFGPDFRVDSQRRLTHGHVIVTINRVGTESGQVSVRFTDLGGGTASGLSIGDGQLIAEIGTAGG